MPDLIAKILIFFVATVFVYISLRLVKPVSWGGTLSRKLCIANAAGWLIILPFSTVGHPPPFLIPTLVFWLINLVLLPTAAIALWMSHREERSPYMLVASTYVAVNMFILFGVPLVWILREARR